MRYVASFLWTGLVVITAAMAEPACGQQAAETPEQKVERVLDESATLEFVDTPLRDVLDFLQDQHNVKIELAPETKQGNKRIDPDVPVSCNLKSLSLRSALHLLLNKPELTQELEVTIKPTGALLLVPSTKELKAKRVESKLQQAAHAKLRSKLLTEMGNVEFINTPLKDVLAFLADQFDCTIALDRTALAAVKADEPISASTGQNPLGGLLQYALVPLDLQVVVQDEVLLVVARDKTAKPKPSPAVAKALATKLDIDLAKPLHVIARHFTEKTGIPFVLHGPALQTAKIQMDRAYVIKAQGVTPAEALKRIEPKLPLQLIERDGIVLISTEAKN